MHKAITLLLCLACGYTSLGQEKLEADRPRVTLTSDLVKGNHLQVEAGLRKEKIADEINLYQHPTLLVRYGLFNAIELRVQATSQTIRNNITKQRVNGLLPVEFGLKGKVLPEYKGFPSVALLAQVGVPGFSSQDYFNPRIPVQLKTLFGNTISKSVKLQYNAGVMWQGDNREARWMYSISPLFRVSDYVNFFVEEYAYLGKTAAAEHYFDGGFQFFLGRDFMVDVSAGVGLSELSSNHFVAAGASFRLN